MDDTKEIERSLDIRDIINNCINAQNLFELIITLMSLRHNIETFN